MPRARPLHKGRSVGQTLDGPFSPTPAGLVILNADLSVVLANQALAEGIGISPKEIIGQNPRSLVPQLAPTIEPLLRRVLSTGIPVLNSRITGETPNQPGVTRHWIVSVFPVEDSNADGPRIGVIVVEVAGSFRFERTKHSGSSKARQALQQSEARYRDLIENSRDLICLHDLEGRLLWMKRTSCQNSGYRRDDLINRRIPDMLEPKIRNEFSDYMTRIQREGHAEGLMRVVARSGERRIWEYQNTLQTGGGLPPMIRGMAHDVTELKRTEQLLRNREPRLACFFRPHRV